jgi:hypothetical protein
MHSGLLVTNQNMKDVVLSVQGVINMQCCTAGITPNVFNACVF